jgi:superfamily II DNA or RNA helicase
MIELRNYQKDVISGLREELRLGFKKFLMVAPTGAGKTVMFSYMISNAVNKGKKCLILTDRSELLTQAGGALSNYGLKPIEIKPGRDLKSLNGLLYVGMAQTLKRRINKEEYQEWFKGLDLIIADEAHKQEFNLLQEHVSPDTIWIGATATPYRESGQKSLHLFYQSIVERVTISSLIKDGFLSSPNSYGVKVDLDGIKTKGGDFDTEAMGAKYDEIQLYHGVYENYTRLTPGKKAIIFASNIQSSKTLVTNFKKRGLPIEHIDGNTPAKDRREILKWFKETPDALISNVGILNAGFDEPTIEVVILYRATKSVSLFLQMCGRGSRVTETKKEFTILDFGNNIHRHGFWEQDRQWSLKNKNKKEGVAPVKDCPECYAILPARTMECPYCHHIFEKTEEEEAQELIAELSKLNHRQIQDEIKTADFKKLEMICRAKGYKRSWIYHQLSTEKDLKDYAAYMGYHKKWVDYQLKQRQDARE